MILCIACAAVVAATSAVSATIAVPAPDVGAPSPAALVVAPAAAAAVPAAVHVAIISTAPATAYPRSISTRLSLPSLRLYFFLATSKRSFCLLILIWFVPLDLFQLELHSHRWTGVASSFCSPALHKIPPALFHSLQYLCSAKFNFDCNLRILRSFFNAVFSKFSMSYSKILHDDAASRWPCPVAQYSPSQDRGLQSADPAISLDRESLHLLHFLIRWELWQGSGLWPKKLATRGQDHRRRPSSPSSTSSPSPSRASRPGQRAPRAQQEQALPIVLSPRLIHC